MPHLVRLGFFMFLDPTKQHVQVTVLILLVRDRIEDHDLLQIPSISSRYMNVWYLLIRFVAVCTDPKTSGH